MRTLTRDEVLVARVYDSLVTALAGLVLVPEGFDVLRKLIEQNLLPHHIEDEEDRLQTEVVQAYFRLLDCQERDCCCRSKSSAETIPSGPQASRGRDGASEAAVRIVDAIGEALGVDTGTINEDRFAAAMRAVQEEMK